MPEAQKNTGGAKKLGPSERLAMPMLRQRLARAIEPRRNRRRTWPDPATPERPRGLGLGRATFPENSGQWLREPLGGTQLGDAEPSLQPGGGTLGCGHPASEQNAQGGRCPWCDSDSLARVMACEAQRRRANESGSAEEQQAAALALLGALEARGRLLGRPATVPSGGPTFDYEFSVWPAANRAPALYEWLDGMPRCSLAKTEGEWARFRDALEREGLTLREVERSPHHEPEVVL